MGLLFREFEIIIWPIVGVMFFVYFDSIVYYSKCHSRYAEIIVYAILVIEIIFCLGNGMHFIYATESLPYHLLHT